jgi:hypothetical protein
MRRALGIVALAAVVTTAAIAAAQPLRRVLVLRSEGAAVDAETRARVDTAVLDLARRGAGGDVTQGDITYGDATTMVGCSGDLAACKDLVLDTLAVDEIVAVSLGPPVMGEMMLTVRRAGRDAAPVEAKGMVTVLDPAARLPAVAGALFGVTAPAAPAAPVPTDPTPPLAAPFPEPAPVPAVEPAPAPPPEPATVTAAPDQTITAIDDVRPARSKLPAIGIGAGGGLVVVGLFLWSKAGDTQDQIDRAPTATRADLERLAALERDADGYATWGNITALGGIALAGVSGYFWWRQRRQARTARLVPAVFDGGAGVTLVIGADP